MPVKADPILPLPPQVDENRVLLAIAPHKDVDGFHPENLGRLVIGEPRFVACTPRVGSAEDFFPASCAAPAAQVAAATTGTFTMAICIILRTFLCLATSLSL
mgnify:CR=1 FL=1